tara:strand:- start:196 stop:432 length:237 start_codon:yes stop_codon:yes gene_type:complete
MKLFSFYLIICFVTFFSETKGNFINDVRDKFGNSDKSYSVKMKSVTKDTKKSESNEKKSKKVDSKKLDTGNNREKKIH